VTLTPELFINGATLIGVGTLIYRVGQWQAKTDAAHAEVAEDLKQHTQREELEADRFRAICLDHDRRLQRVEDRLSFKPSEVRP
jgi:hypothetical protein